MRESVFLRIDCDDPVRLWGGLGDIWVAADDVEPEDSIYLGGGELLSAPDFQQLINDTAERLDLAVNGVSPTAYKLAIEEAESVKGARVDFGTAQFDEHWQQIGPIVWETVFRADTLTGAGQPGDNGRILSLTLSIGTDDTDRSQAPIAFWTQSDQHRAFPTDNFFDHVSGITAGTSRRFGPSDG